MAVTAPSPTSPPSPDPAASSLATPLSALRTYVLQQSLRLWLIGKTLPVLWTWSRTAAGPAGQQPASDAAAADDGSGEGEGEATASRRSDAGQTTAEYGLVILAAGTLALAVILWARSSGSITDLFESVINQLTGDIG